MRIDNLAYYQSALAVPDGFRLKTTYVTGITFLTGGQTDSDIRGPALCTGRLTVHFNWYGGKLPCMISLERHLQSWEDDGIVRSAEQAALEVALAICRITGKWVKVVLNADAVPGREAMTVEVTRDAKD